MANRPAARRGIETEGRLSLLESDMDDVEQKLFGLISKNEAARKEDREATTAKLDAMADKLNRIYVSLVLAAVSLAMTTLTLLFTQILT